MRIKDNKKIIGVLGGMGPQASIYLYKMLIELSGTCFGAKNNDDFPEIIIYSTPVPDFISSCSRRKIAFKMLKQRVIKLNNFNVLYFAIACNTAHILIEQLQNVSKAPFLSIIDEVVKKVNGDKINKVGLLATPSTIKYSLYQKALKKRGINTVFPNKKEQSFTEKAIRNVLRGKILKSDREKLIIIANSLKKRRAKGVVLGCTELPLVFPRKYSLPVYDSVKILAMALLQKYYKQNTI